MKLALTKDSLRLGLLLGIIAPFFGMFIFYFWKFYPTFSLKEFFTVLFMQKTLVTGIVGFSLFANAVIFTLYINTRKDRTAKGIFIVTVIYAVSAIIFKLFL